MRVTRRKETTQNEPRLLLRDNEERVRRRQTQLSISLSLSVLLQAFSSQVFPNYFQTISTPVTNHSSSMSNKTKQTLLEKVTRPYRTFVLFLTKRYRKMTIPGRNIFIKVITNPSEFSLCHYLLN